MMNMLSRWPLPLVLLAGVACSASPEPELEDPISEPVTRDAPPPPPPAASSGPPVRNESLVGRQVFPEVNWWNLDISDAPVDPRSDELIAYVREDSKSWGDQYDRLHPDFASGSKRGLTGGIRDPFGIPYITVPGDQPLVEVHFKTAADSPSGYAPESDYEWPGRRGGYPIPDRVRTEWGWIQHGTPGGGDDQDYHLIIIDRDNWILYELWHAKYEEGVGWTAGSGAIFDLSENGRRPEGWTSADAAGLAIFPGLIRADEVFGPGEIEHALRVTFIGTADYYVWPANHVAGSDPRQLPNGARLRLKADVDISGYPAVARKIFRAFKRHGLIVADNGGPGFVTGTMDPRWDNSVLNPAFHSLDLGDFEVIELGWRP